jgi:hypothetical protein
MHLLNWSVPKRQGHDGFGLPGDLPTFKINAHGRWLGEMIVAHMELALKARRISRCSDSAGPHYAPGHPGATQDQATGFLYLTHRLHLCLMLPVGLHALRIHSHVAEESGSRVRA